MSKKFIAALCVLTLMLSISAAALGTGARAGGSGAAVSSDNAAALSQLKTDLEQARQNTLQSRIQTTENSRLREQCRVQISEIQDEETDLSEETLGELQQLRAQLQTLYDDLAATKGEVRSHMLQFRAGRLSKDYDGMQEEIESVLQTQQTRLELKEQINQTLQQMVGLLTPAD